MHGQQCQGCGSYDDSSTRGVNPCEHCSTLICQSCTRNHSPLCKELQARKLRGEGPTIGNVPMFAHRRGHETPPTTGPDRRFVFTPPEQYEAVKAEIVKAGLTQAAAPADRPDLSTPEKLHAFVDKGILEVVQGFKDLIDGNYVSSVDKLESEAIEKQLDAIKDLLAE